MAVQVCNEMQRAPPPPPNSTGTAHLALPCPASPDPPRPTAPLTIPAAFHISSLPKLVRLFLPYSTESIREWVVVKPFSQHPLTTSLSWAGNHGPSKFLLVCLDSEGEKFRTEFQVLPTLAVYRTAAGEDTRSTPRRTRINKPIQAVVLQLLTRGVRVNLALVILLVLSARRRTTGAPELGELSTLHRHPLRQPASRERSVLFGKQANKPTTPPPLF